MNPQSDIVRRATEIQNPEAKTWRDYFLSRFSGAMPKEVTDVPTILEIIPSELREDKNSVGHVTGFFEYSSNLATANCGAFDGEIDLTTRRFRFKERSPKEPWTFDGYVSENGQVIHLRLSSPEIDSSEEFCLIQEDTFATLIPADYTPDDE